MSVLTVAGSAALPGRTLEYPRTTSFASHSHPHPRSPQPPASPGRIPPVEYTRHSAQSQQYSPATFHRHSRTISSAVLPSELSGTTPHEIPPQLQPRQAPRTHSQTHSRQSSTSTFGAMQRQPTVNAYAPSAPRRSTSSRSAGTTAPTSYVALMRKQKATVWCDRSQNIDPRLAAAQRAAKQRAVLEVNVAISSTGRTSTISSSGMVGKIRHGGIPKAPGYSSANMSGAIVPLRLSANEMLGDDEGDEHSFRGDNAMAHGRSGSGKSTASSRFRSGYPRPEGKLSGTNTPPGPGDMAKDHIPELAETTERSELDVVRQSSESEDSFGEIKELRGPSALQQAIHEAKKNEDLRRRGSVDERTMSMGAGVRLFVANPDLDD